MKYLKFIQWAGVWIVRNAIALKDGFMHSLDPCGEDDETNRDHER